MLTRSGSGTPGQAEGGAGATRAVHPGGVGGSRDGQGPPAQRRGAAASVESLRRTRRNLSASMKNAERKRAGEPEWLHIVKTQGGGFGLSVQEYILPK